MLASAAEEPPVLRLPLRAGPERVVDTNLYATWDTQAFPGDIGRLSYSTDHSRTWSAPIRVTADSDNAVHNVESAGVSPGIADIAWQADNSSQGYATYLRPFPSKTGG